MIAATLPPSLKIATWACTHGYGWLGAKIRYVEERLGATHEQAWAGHCVIFVGDQVIVQGQAPVPAVVSAQWPNVRLRPASDYRDAIYATGQPLTPAQRRKGQVAALAMVGMKYDLVAYLSFINSLAHLAFMNDLNPLFAIEAREGPICSGTVVREQIAMGVDISKLRVAANRNPDNVSPADVLGWGLANGWMDHPVPGW